MKQNRDMKQHRRRGVITLLIILALIAAACGDDGDAATEVDDATTIDTSGDSSDGDDGAGTDDDGSDDDGGDDDSTADGDAASETTTTVPVELTASWTGVTEDVSVTSEVIERYRAAYDRFEETLTSFARSRGAGFVRLDCDEPVVPQLATIFESGRLAV